MDHYNLCPGCFDDSSGQNPCPSCGYETETAEASLYLIPGTILSDKYLVGRLLGQGGFGITYLGWDMNLDMKLAVKEFFPQGLVSRLPGQSKVISLAGTEAHQFGYWQDRFLQEAKTLAQFEHHPNIVSVRDFFKANGTAYMVMSYVEGLTLDQYLAQAGGKLSFDKTIEVMMPVMDALREVHEVGVMHRDISPDNIFIDNRGRVVLLDFGAARQEISGQSKSISVILKAGYAPEEQYRSRGKQGPWTDVYAVGATIYRLITGQVPPDAMDRLDEDTLKPPSELGVDIAAKQETQLLKGLAIKAKNRYQTIDELQEELLSSRVKPVTTIVTEFKNCPYCGEEISAKAIKCKYCHSALEEEIKTSEVAPSKEKNPVEGGGALQADIQTATELPLAITGHFQETETVDLDCPVEMESYSINAASVAEKVFAEIKFRNLSNKTVNALRVSIYCFDAFGEEVKSGDETVFDKRLQDLSAKPGEIFSATEPFELKGFADARQVKVLVQSILFDDHSRWDYEGGQVYEVSTAVLSKQELADLREAAGPISVCYARKEKAYWQCVCGRANLLSADSCVRCRNNRKNIFQNASSKEKVEAFLLKIMNKRIKEAVILTYTENIKPNYVIDQKSGNIPLSTLPIGSLIVDISWQWEFRTGKNYTHNGDKKEVVWIVVARNHYSGLEDHVTLLAAQIIGLYCFDEKRIMFGPTGKNLWNESGGGDKAVRGLRPWLNSSGSKACQGFYQAFSETFKKAVIATTVPNCKWWNGQLYSTNDQVFIPSTTELGDDAHKHTYPIGSTYPYFTEASIEKRVAYLGSETRWYWTRSPASGNGSRVRYVYATGAFGYNIAYFADSGVRPALNLKADTLVSEIRD